MILNLVICVSGGPLHWRGPLVFRLSSVVEQVAVNHRVVGSSPAVGANYLIILKRTNMAKQSICKTDTYGTKEWYKNGKLHREDGPACEYANGHKEWYLNGRTHREDGPAVEYANGDKSWYKNGQLHREDGPAIERYNGTKDWYLNDKKIEDPNKCHHDCCNNEK